VFKSGFFIFLNVLLLLTPKSNVEPFCGDKVVPGSLSHKLRRVNDTMKGKKYLQLVFLKPAQRPLTVHLLPLDIRLKVTLV
jgi:hypothetical protein